MTHTTVALALQEHCHSMRLVNNVRFSGFSSMHSVRFCPAAQMAGMHRTASFNTYRVNAGRLMNWRYSRPAVPSSKPSRPKTPHWFLRTARGQLWVLLRIILPKCRNLSNIF